MTISVNIGGDAMNQVLTKVILDALGEEEKNNIIAQAVKHLFAPDRRTYGNMTPLQEAFNSAIDQYARTVVGGIIAADPELRAKIDEYIRPLLDSFGKRVSEDVDLKRIAFDAIVDYVRENEV